jgi:hypothetical protein
LPVVLDRDKVDQAAKSPTIFPLADLNWRRDLPRPAKAAEVRDAHIQKLGSLLSPDYPLPVQFDLSGLAVPGDTAMKEKMRLLYAMIDVENKKGGD